jgi:two-component system NtrC family response regulator
MIASIESQLGSVSLDGKGRDLLGSSAILVVDDEPGMRNFLRRALEPECALLEVVDSVETGEEVRQRYHFDLLVLDIRLSGRSGLEWVTDLREQGSQVAVIFITAYADLETAVSALRAEAGDFILKPFRMEQLIASIRRCLERRAVLRENILLRRQVAERVLGLEGMVGSSEAIEEVCRVVRRVAPTTSTVLVQGETGTGKELIARAIHEHSGRHGPFVPVNCGSISAELLESELFGHTRGAFTGAHASREGLFSYAHEGTLFLDEIGEMPLSMQGKVLRALEERCVRPVGGDREIPVDVRVIAATNRSLEEEAEQQRFRADLLYRLNVLTITAPALRDRLADVPLLVEHFLGILSAELGLPPIPLRHGDMAPLQGYRWPGNVRELRNVIERSLLLGRLPAECLQGGTPDDSSVQAGAPGYPESWTLAQVEKQHMQRVIESVAGNKSEAARRLGVSRKTLERKAHQWRRADSKGEPD